MQKKLWAVLLIVAFLMSLFAMPACAETIVQDGLEVTLTTDKDEYSADEKIEAEVTIKNTNDFVVTDISIEMLFPNGYVLQEDSNLRINRLQPGEEKLIKLNVINQNIENNLPETGDGSNIGGWIAVMGAALAGALALFARKKCGQRIVCLLLCAVMLSSAVAYVPSVAMAQTELRRLTVEKAIKMNGADDTVCAVVTYGMQVPYTRAQWIAVLVERFGYTAEETLTPSYADIAGSQYEKQIEAAAVRNLIPESGEMFRPDDAATREFAAATAVRFMGYAMEGNLQCADAAQLTTPQEDRIAVDIGAMPLIGDKFYPERTLSQAEAQTVLESVDEVISSTEYNGNGGKGFVFSEGVLTLPETFRHREDGNTLIMAATDETKALKVGDIFVIGNTSAYKVQSIRVDGEDVIIEFVHPDLVEFLDEMELYGMGYLDFSQFIPEEGVTVQHNNARRMMRSGDSINIPDAKIEIDGDVDLGNNWKFKYGLSFKATKAYYCFDIDHHFITGWFTDEKVLDFKNVYLKLDVSGDVSGGIGRAAGDDGKLWQSPRPLFKEIKLGYVPIVGTDGFGALVEVKIVATLDGSLSLRFDWGGIVGAQVLNNKVRNVTDIDTGLTASLAGEFKIGPELFAVAEVFDKKLISFGVNVGGKAGGEIDWRMDGALVCMEGKAGVYGKLTALDKTIIKDKLNISGSWDFLDKDIVKGHWENLVKVPECTYNHAVIRGTVADARNRTDFIKGANVSVYKADGMSLVGTASSDKNGEYTLSVPSGDVVLKVSKTGYIPFEARYSLETEQEQYVETLLMVEGEEDTDETGVIGGRISDASTGAAVSGVKLTVRKNWNVTSGAAVKSTTTNSSGQYSVELPLGNYTITMEKAGFVTGHINVAVTRGQNSTWHGTLVPEQQDPDNPQAGTGNLRIVLTWGARPYDLDSHLRGPASNGQFHVYYSNKTSSGANGKLADLDVDDTSSYGPETVTIYNMDRGGMYSYYVHDFSNRAYDGSSEMSNSGAQVKVYRGSALLATYNIPTSRAGTVWHVFDYDANTNKLIPVNTFSSESNADAVGGMMRSRARIISPDKE